MARAGITLFLASGLTLLPCVCGYRLLSRKYRASVGGGIGVGVTGNLTKPAAPLCEEGQAQWQHWTARKVRIFIYNASTLAPVVKQQFRGTESSWWQSYEQWSRDPLSPPKLHNDLTVETARNPEVADGFIQAGLYARLQSRWPNMELVDQADDAEIVLWLVWDFALCMASGYKAEKWEVVKGRLAQSCPAHWCLLRWLRETSRWKRSGGADHVFLVANPFSWESYWDVHEHPLAQEALPLPRPEGSVEYPPDLVANGPTRSSILASTEDRRAKDASGGSHVIPVPYYVDYTKVFAQTRKDRKYLVGFSGSVDLKRLSCVRCLNGILPRDIRRKLLNELDARCITEASRHECKTYNLDNEGQKKGISRKSAHLFEAAGVKLESLLQEAAFCPIPRGDSAATKRFFSAIVAGCVPVVISDYLPLPFDSFVDYGNAILRIPEKDFMQPDFSLLDLLRAQSPERLAELRTNLDWVRRAISFSPRGEGELLPRDTDGPVEQCSLIHPSEGKRDALDYFLMDVLRTHVSLVVGSSGASVA